jgi:hypothetical protein
MQLPANALTNILHTLFTQMAVHLVQGGVSGTVIYRCPLVFCPRFFPIFTFALARSGLSAQLAPPYIARSFHRTNTTRFTHVPFLVLLTPAVEGWERRWHEQRPADDFEMCEQRALCEPHVLVRRSGQPIVPGVNKEVAERLQRPLWR